MKKGIITSIISLYTIALFAGAGITVTQKYTGADVQGATVNVTWYVSASQCKMKMEYADNTVNSVNWFVPELSSGNLLIYTEGDVPANAQKAYFTVPVQQIKAGGDVSVSRVKVEKTGELKSVGGFQCEKVVIKTNKNITEMWVTKDFKPDYYKFSPYFQNSFALLGLSEESIPGFPIESVTKDNTGNVVSSSQFIAGSNTNFTEADFKVPAEYKSAEELAAPTSK